MGCEPSWVLPVISNAPLLQELQLFSTRNTFPTDIPDPEPFSQLIKLKIPRIESPEEALDILEFSPQLQSFSAAAICAFMDLSTVRSITHQNLVHLHIVDGNTVDDGNLKGFALLKFLTLPSLQTLHVSEGEFRYADLKATLERSRCHLTGMTLNYISLRQRDHIAVFGNILRHKSIHMSLKTLEIQHSWRNNQHFLKLFPFDPKEPLLPSLERLCISDYRFEPSDSRARRKLDGLLTEIVTSRLTRGLRYFSVTGLEGADHRSDITRMKELSRSRLASNVTTETCVVELGIRRYSKCGRERWRLRRARFVLPISTTCT